MANFNVNVDNLSTEENQQFGYRPIWAVFLFA